MQVRGRVDSGDSYVRPQSPGDILMTQEQVVAITTAGAGTLTAAAMNAGIVDRSGPVLAYDDTLDIADNLMAANPGLTKGDTFRFTFRNTVAFAMTMLVAEGAELDGANTACAASQARNYLVTILATKRKNVAYVSSTNASAVLTGFTEDQIKAIEPGMGVSGTNMPASGTVIGVNALAKTVTLSGNATGTGTQAVTFFPRYKVKGISAAAI